jgi:hypothetical protein
MLRTGCTLVAGSGTVHYTLTTKALGDPNKETTTSKCEINSLAEGLG